MGYETKLMVISGGTGKNRTGYNTVEATLEMGKINYNEIGNLISTAIKKAKANAKEHGLEILIKAVKEGEANMYDAEGNHTDAVKLLTETQRDALYKRTISKYRNALEKHFPYVYESGDEGSFVDRYDAPLMVVEIDDLIKAIKKDQAKSIMEDGYSYRRYDVALALLEPFRDSSGHFKGCRVVLFGH